MEIMSREEDGRLFQTATNSISLIIQSKRDGTRITDKIVDEIVLVLQMEEMKFSRTQQQTAGAAIIVSSKAILPKMTTPEKISLIRMFNQGLEMISTFDELPGFRWSNVQPLFHMYMDAIPRDSPGATKVLNFLLKIFDVLKSSPHVNEDFFSYHSILTLGRLINKTMEIITNSTCDVELRKLALEVVSRLIRQCPPSKAPTISLIISGFLGNLMKTMKGVQVNAELMENSINLFTDAVVLVFSDNAEKFDISKINLEQYHPEMHKMFDNQTVEWRQNGSDIIFEYMRNLLSFGFNHRVFDVKKAMCQMIIKIQTECGQLFGKRNYNLLMNQYFYLRYDDYPYFQELAEKCISLVNDRETNRLFFMKQLSQYTTTLPVLSRNGGKSDQHFKALCASLRALGESITLMCTTGSETIELLLRSLADTIVIEKRRLMITSDTTVDTIEKFLLKFKLQYQLSHENVKLVCDTLVEFGKLEVIDMVHNLMQVEPLKKRSSYHIILAYMLSAVDLETTAKDDPVILMIAEYLTSETNKSCVIKLKDDSKPLTHGTELDWSTCIESLSLVNVTLCMKFIGEIANRSNVSVNCLCTIINQTNSLDWVVRESADFSLKTLAKQDSRIKDVKNLVGIYSSHILNQVSLACMSSDNYHLAPVLLISFLKIAGIGNHFDVLKVIVEKMLYALDNNQQRYLYGILATIQTFMSALLCKYPNQKPVEPPKESEDEKSSPTPQHILVEKILLRTKHMLTSELLFIQLKALDILLDGLDFLKCYDDMLLPMIHQNWHGVMEITKDKNPLTLIVIIQCIENMSEQSGSFVQSKVLREFWPTVEHYFMDIMKNKQYFEQTAEYKLGVKIIEAAPEIVIYIGFTEQEAEGTFVKLLDLAIQQNGCFSSFARVEKKKIDEHFKNLKQKTVESKMAR